VGVGINETRSHNQICSVNDLLGAVGHRANLNNLPSNDRHIGVTTRRSRAIDHRAIFNQQVIHTQPS
jgi:hypothetical protein